MSKTTNQQVLAEFEESIARYWRGKEKDLNRLYEERKPFRAAVLARMVQPLGWMYRGTPWSADLETAAEKVYSGFSHLPGYVPWTKGGNSDKQNEARDFVWRALDTAHPAEAPARREGGAEP